MMQWLTVFLANAALFILCECNQLLQKDIFNTKTPYFWVRSESDTVSENAFSTITHNSRTCTAVGANILLRHGSRYPTSKWIKRIDSLLSKLKGQNEVANKHSFITQYKNPYLESQAGLLSPLGENEMFKLGQRFGTRLKSTFKDRINQVNYFVSRKSRTQTSFANFFKGLNNTNPTPGNASSATIDNKKIRFYDSCTRYIDDVEDSDDAFKERDDFEEGDNVNEIVVKVRNKLGGTNYLLSKDEVLTIHQLCAFELGLTGASEWCKFFEIEDLRVIEYLYDLESYIEGGYGFPITRQQTCPYTSYLFERFNDIVDDYDPSREPMVDIFFGHSETIIPIYSAFGLFKDSKSYTADQYTQNGDRLFKTSEIAPFSANIAFLLYKCEGTDEFSVKIYVNEEPVAIPACGNTLCSYSEVKEYYDDLIECDFDTICASDSVALQTSVLISMFCLLVHLLI